MENLYKYNYETVLGYGEYKNRMLKNIPCTWFRHILKSGHSDKILLQFINENLNDISYCDKLNIKHNNRRDDVIPIKTDFGCKLIGKNLVITCPVTDKVVFIDEFDAKKEITKLKFLNSGNKKPHRCYECEYCGGWHLTSATNISDNKFKEQ